ncbi:M56 family metallopeptidase [Haloferula chungangensis]|uniref:M56 family metallopeptidase n=1 Tax=Haloferula chungangensis TaxID=1048331 RepID=A0ABW2L2S1_9BACT
MPLTAIVFSLIASLLVWLCGRRDTVRAPQVTAVTITLLLAFPLLSLLPKFAILPASEDVVSRPSEIGKHLQVLWISGAAFLSLRVFLATLAIERWRSASRLIESIPWGRREIEVRSLASIQSPVAAGVLRPVVLVPENWASWPDDVRQMVLAHELAHHRRFDPFWRSLGAMACALHWFNPLVWWLVRHHAVQAEFACDAMVIREGIKAPCYASVLCDLASSQSSPIPAAALSERRSLAQRVHRLMHPSGGISPALTALLIAAIVLAAIGMAVLQRANQSSSPVPVIEVQTRLSADPFPGN